MKKNILKTLAGLGLMLVMVIGVYSNNVKDENIVLLENIEALAMASGESGGGRLYCCPSSSDCVYLGGDICVVCGSYNCVYYYEYNENCGLAGTCNGG